MKRRQRGYLPLPARWPGAAEPLLIQVLAWPPGRLGLPPERELALRERGLVRLAQLPRPCLPTLSVLVRQPAGGQRLDRRPQLVLAATATLRLCDTLLNLARLSLWALQLVWEEKFLEVDASDSYVTGVAGGGHLRMEVQWRQERVCRLQLQDWYTHRRRVQAAAVAEAEAI